MTPASTEDSVNERLDPSQSVHYSGKKDGTGVENFSTLTTEKFEEILKKRVDFFCNSDFDREGMEAPGNLLIFGAPGIGKSTIPRAPNISKLPGAYIRCSWYW